MKLSVNSSNAIKITNILILHIAVCNKASLKIQTVKTREELVRVWWIADSR
jgi:hypothetical protein